MSACRGDPLLKAHAAQELRAMQANIHTSLSYLSIVVHQRMIVAFKSTPKSAQIRAKVGQIGQNFSFSLLKSSPA